MGGFIQVAGEIVFMGVVCPIHFHNFVLETVAVLFSVIKGVGEIAHPVNLIPSGIMTVSIEIAIFCLTGNNNGMDRITAFLAIEEQNITRLDLGILGCQSVNSIGGNHKITFVTQTGINQCIFDTINAACENFNTTGLQTCFYKLIADADSVIPVICGIVNSSLRIIARTKFCSFNLQRHTK